MIKLGDGWQIDSDGNQYILSQELVVAKGKNKGSTYIGAQSYHTSLQSAISSLLKKYQMMVINEDDYSLQEALQVLKQMQNEFEQLLNSIRDIEVVGNDKK